MKQCLNCGSRFDHPKIYIETHNLSCPPYEEFAVCPFCEYDYVDIYRCVECNKEILEGIETSRGMLCQMCFTDIYSLEGLNERT